MKRRSGRPPDWSVLLDTWREVLGSIEDAEEREALRLWLADVVRLAIERVEDMEVFAALGEGGGG